jgi:hypothetical protein
MLARLAQMQFRGAIVGPEGSGKTTLLGELERRMVGHQRVCRWQLRRDEPWLWHAVVADVRQGLAAGDFVLLDGAEQLNMWNWRWFLRRTRAAAGLIITLHHPGRLPTWVECRPSLPLVDELVTELTGSADESVHEMNRKLFAQQQGNVRLVLRKWYDLCAADAAPPSPQDPIA